MSKWQYGVVPRGCKVALVGVIVAVLCLVSGCDGSEEPVGAGPAADVGLVDYVALKSENEALRRENQMLRRELVSKNGALPDSVLPDKGVDSPPADETSVGDTGYWLATNSKVRHNKRCRNYRKVKGRPCGPTEGRPCKMCGG